MVKNLARYYDHNPRDAEFIQRVRRHKPSSLIPLISAAGSQYAELDSWLKSPWKKLSPWVLAEATRVSLSHGTEYNRTNATGKDLLQICAAYDALLDPGIFSDQGLANYMLRLIYQQFRYRASPWTTISRTLAVLEQTTPTRQPKVIRPGWDRDLLGASLQDYFNVVFLTHVWAAKNQGKIDLGLLDQPVLAFLNEVIGRDTVTTVINDKLSITSGDFRLQSPRAPSTETRRFTANPLWGRPLLRTVDSDPLSRHVPTPTLVMSKASLASLYHEGQQRYGQQFTVDLGYYFEAYVGRQLQQLPGARVLPEITYGRDQRQSVDWIVIFDDLVVIVEAKGMSPVESIRTADTTLQETLVNKFGKAVKQIRTTSQLIQQENAAFAEVPPNRPIIGLVVTLEQFYLTNSPAFPQVREALDDAGLPIIAVSIDELEHFVALSDDQPSSVLRQYPNVARQTGGDLKSHLLTMEYGSNQVLDSAWESLEWITDRVPHRPSHQ